MAQTILTPGGDAESVSTPPPDSVNPFEDLIPIEGKAKSLELGDFSLELTDKEKAITNPFLDLPKANLKNPLETAQEAYRIGQESVGLDFDAYSLQRRNLLTGQAPTKAELDALDEQERRLSVEAYYNQADNIASGTAYKAIEMLPPMLTGTVEGFKEGGQMGLAGAIGGAAMGSLMAGVGAAPGAAIGGKAGFAVGTIKGSYDYWTKQGTGASYRELLKNDVDPNVAAQISQFVGPAYAAVEYAQVNQLIGVAGGRALKSALLRGAMRGLAKVLPKATKAVTAFGKTAVGKATEFTAIEAGEEAVQEGITATGTAIGRAQAEAIKADATADALDVLAQLDLGDAGEILGRSLTAFKESVGPLAVLGGTAKLTGAGLRKTGKVIENIASGELNELSDLREKISAAGAPRTAEAMASIESITPTLKPEDTVGLEEDLEAAGVPIAPTAAPVPTPVTPTPEPEPTPVRAPKAITKPMRTTLKDMGYSDEAIDKLAPQDALDVIAGGEAAMVPPTPAVTPAVEPEKEKAAEAPTAEAPAVVPTGVQPKAPKEGAAPVVPTLEQPEARPNILARNWLAEVDRAKNKRERQDLIDIFRGKLDSLSEDERQAAKIFDSELIRRTEQPKVEAVAPTTPAPAPAPTTEAPKMQAPPALPKWEDVLKNQRQIRFLRKVFKDANAQLPKDRQITPKAGWKGQDFFKALENIYGQLTQLEFAKPELKAPAPGAVAPAPVNKAAEKRKAKLRGMVKVFSNVNLNGDQIYFRDTALEMARRMSKQVGAEFENLVNASEEIYTRLVERIAGRLYSSVNLNRPILFNQEGQPTDLTEENISKYVMFSARRAALDALKAQEARAEVAAEFGTAPAEGAVTQPEAAREEAKPAGTQVATTPTAPVVESRAVTALREAAKIIRDQSGPEVKLVIDWIVDNMIGADTELGKLKTYKELAEYLSKVAGRKISDKRVGEFVNKTVGQISENLKDENIKARAEDLMMLLTPEGRAARERKAAEEAERKQAREVRQAIANLADRARNLKAGVNIKQALVDAISAANTVTRARITSEIIIPLENGLIEESEVAQRLDNIQKGIENAKPRVRQVVPRRGLGAARQIEEGQIPRRVGEGVEGERGRPSAGATAEGRPQPAAGGVAPVGARPSGVGQAVGQEQPAAPSPISFDPKLIGKNKPPVIKAFVETATSSGFPASYVVDENSGKPVSVSVTDAEGDAENPIIYINPKLLAEAARSLKTKSKFDEWAYLSINEEVAHWKYLKLLKSEANELGISYRQHLKNETKRVASIIKKRRGLKKRLELIYNNGNPFSGELGNFQMVFEYQRMLTQTKMTGKFTELTWLAESTDLLNILRSLEAQERRFIFRFLDAIRQFIYGVTGRTAAETRFLRQTADSVAQMAQRVTRDLAKPNEVQPVSMNYFPPKEDSLAKVSPKEGELKKAREELKKDTGLSRANLQFLKDYAEKLGIKVPTTKRKVTVFNEKTRKYEDKEFRVPFWKKADYVNAIKAKLKELGDKGKLGAALPSMRFKTEYAFRQLDESVGKRGGLLKSLTVAEDGTVPWETLKAKLMTHRFKGKGLSRAEAEWVIPTLETLVRNGRVNVEQAIQAMKALASKKLSVNKLLDPFLDKSKLTNDEIAQLQATRDRANFFHNLESKFKATTLVKGYVERLNLPELFQVFGGDPTLKRMFYMDRQAADWEAANTDLLGKIYRAEGRVGLENLKQALEAEAKVLRQIDATYARSMLEKPSEEVQKANNFSEIIDKAYTLALKVNDPELREMAMAKAGSALFYNAPASMRGKDKRASVKYTIVNPKAGVSEMKDLREILVEAPGVETWAAHYPSFKNVLGFGRMYTTTQNNKTGTFLFEVQTDVEKLKFLREDPEAELIKVFGAGEDIQKILKASGNGVRVSENSFNPFDPSDIVPDNYRDDFMDGDRILKGDFYIESEGEPPDTIGRKIGENTYHIKGLVAIEFMAHFNGLTDLQKQNSKIKISEEQVLRPDEKKFVAQQQKDIAENRPLIDAYESLVLKQAIADAVSKNQDFIAITDAETAAMTEGHDRVKEGMRVHYDPRRGSLHNIARKLTGDIGTPFDDGRSTYVDEQEEADRLERPPSVIRRYAKTNVTGVAYSLDKVKALGEDSEIYNILGAALPTDRPYWLKPDGEIVDVEETALVDLMSVGSHAEAAIGWMEENAPEEPFLTEWKLLDPLDRKERQQLPVMKMLEKGWLRVVGDAFNLYFEGNPNQTQLDRLFEAAINDEVKLIQDLSGLTGRARSKTIYEPPLEDELGVAMPRRGYSTTEFKTSLDWAPLPDSIEGFKFLRNLPGSFDVRLYRDDFGNKFVVKRGQSQEQFENEIAAENIYRILKYPVPQSKLITTPEGETAKIANYIDGPTLAEFEKEFKDIEPETVNEVYRQIGDGLLVDAFLFNYDVLGADKENIVISMEEIFDERVISGIGTGLYNTAYRVDNGGTFDTRALGLKREEPFFYDSLAKLRQKYPKFQLKATDLLAQLGDIVLNSDAILNSIPERLRPMMAQRLQWMFDQLSATDTLPANSGRTTEEIAEHFRKLATEMSAVRLAKNEQGQLINLATGKPSQIKILNAKGQLVRVEPKSEFRYRLERTPSFKMWYGDWENFPEGKGTSKILDEAGEPLIMYHGTALKNRELSSLFVKDAEITDSKNPMYALRSHTTANAFRGIWLSSSREFAEEYSNLNTHDQYDENVVLPVYVKATNPFDPRNPEHIEKLFAYARGTEEMGRYKLENVEKIFPERARVSVEQGFYDWTRFEGSLPGVGGFMLEALPERQRRFEFFKTFPYGTLEAIINLGFDAIWVKEKPVGLAGSIEQDPKYRIDEIIAARLMNEKDVERESIRQMAEDVEVYNNNSSWNLLAWRPDAVKSSVNSGKFKSKPQLDAIKPTNEAMAKASRVKKNGNTLWNEFVKDGVTYASYDSPEQLVSYAYMTVNQLSKNNIAKEVLSEELVYVGKRLVPRVRTDKGRETADILGSSMPRRFGVRLKDKVSEEAYSRLKNLRYEPIPDAMTEAEADAYLDKNGLRGSMDAALSDASPLQHGSRELLAQKIIIGMNEMYNRDKDPRILDDLLTFLDRFLEQTSGIGRALRALQFWSYLTPEGMLMLYKKKSDETNREVRDRFNVFFDKVKSELANLPEGTIDEVLKKMSGVLGKAQNAADESRKKLAENNMMTFWEQFANQMGESIADKAQQQLDEAEAVAAQATGVPLDQLAPEQRKAIKRLENAKSINQSAQEMSREIKRMFMALAEEQGRRIRDPRINTDEEFANLTIDEQEKLRKEEREAAQKKNFTAMLARWPKALQAWKQTSDAIRARVANNPELAEMFNGFLNLVLESPFTMPQLKRFIALRGIKIEDLIREHYEEGKLANNAYSLARELVQEAGLGAWEEEIGADEKGAEGLFKFRREEGMKKEEPAIREKMEPLSERLANAIALQIQEIVAKETEKKLNRLIKSYANKTLEPSLYRFAKRFVEYQALGLFSNSNAWNEFQKQEGLDKLKPEVVTKITNIMGEAQKLVGYRKDEKISDALSLIAYETQNNKLNFAKSWWYVSILSGVGTQAANFLGNATNTALMAIPTMGRFMFRSVTNKSAAKATLGSMFRALSLSFRDAGNILMTGRVGTRKAEPKFFGKAATDYFEFVARNSTGTTVGIKNQTLATYISMIRRVMTAVDMTFYNFNKEVYLFEAAYQMAKDQGLKDEAATAKALELTFRDSEKLAAAKALAEKQGYVVDSEDRKTRFLQQAEQAIRVQEIIDDSVQKDYAELAAVGQIYGTETTFNEEPRGVLGAFHRMIGAFAKEHPLKTAVFVPFTRIVANVWNQSIDFTGWGLARSGALAKPLGKIPVVGQKLTGLADKFAMEYKGTAEEIKIQKDLAYVRGMTGLSTVFLLGLLDQMLCGNYEKYGMEFCINGSGPKEAAQKELLKNRLGWKPNSIYIKLNLPGFRDGVYASYMFSPLAMGLSAIGLFNDNETYGYFNEKSLSDVTLAMAHRIATIMFDMNFLSGASDLFEMLNPSEPERALAKAKSFLSRLGSAVIVPNLVRDVDQLLVSPALGYKGRTAREGPVQGAFVANTPIARHIYGQEELDMLGQPIEMQFRPSSWAKKDALLETLVRKNALPSAPKKDRLFSVVKMTDSQYADYRAERARQLGASLGQPGVLEQLEGMTPEMAQLYVGRLVERANALGKAKLIRENPEVLEEMREEKTKGLR